MGYIVFAIGVFCVLIVCLTVSGIKHTCTIRACAKTVIVEKGVSHNIIPPKIAGFSFGGWFLDVELEHPFDESAPVTHDITLFPKYIQITQL